MNIIVFCMCTNKSNINCVKTITEKANEPVFIMGNIKNYSSITYSVSTWKISNYFIGVSKIIIFHFLQPHFQCNTSIFMRIPKFLNGTM